MPRLTTERYRQAARARRNKKPRKSEASMDSGKNCLMSGATSIFSQRSLLAALTISSADSSLSEATYISVWSPVIE